MGVQMGWSTHPILKQMKFSLFLLFLFVCLLVCLFFNPNLFFNALVFILRIFCYRPNGNRMFLKEFIVKHTFRHFPVFYRFDVCDVIMTSYEFFVFPLVDMDRGNQGQIYIGTWGAGRYSEGL